MLLLTFKNKNFSKVLKLFTISNTTEKNKNQAKNESIISFNEDQIELCLTPMTDSTLDLEIKYKKTTKKENSI